MIFTQSDRLTSGPLLLLLLASVVFGIWAQDADILTTQVPIMYVGPNQTPLHPESASFLTALAADAGDGDTDVDLETLRKQFDDVGNTTEYPPFPGVISDIYLPTGKRREIKIRVYKPDKISSDPNIMIHYHGGGYVLGSVKMADLYCRLVAERCSAIVVSVEYRLAPENKLPAALLDGAAAARWVLSNRDSVGGSPESKVGVSGDSAGGHLAAWVAHEVRGLSFEVLVYPMDFRLDYYSMEEFESGLNLDKATMEWVIGLALPSQELRYNPRYELTLRKKFDNLPPTLVILAECDPLRDAGRRYHKILRDAGVKSELVVMKGALHGFYDNPAHFKELTAEAYDVVAGFLKIFDQTDESPKPPHSQRPAS